MKKIVIICGLISGLILAIVMFTSFYFFDDHFSFGMLIGYSSMLLSFSLIFVAIKTWRDKYNNGIISFGKAFKIGLFISLIASSMYVLAWTIEYYFFIPDFMDQYAAHIINKAKADGATAEEILKQTTDMAKFKEMYKKPLFMVLLTFSEVLPVGLLISLICAFILRRKTGPAVQTV